MSTTSIPNPSIFANRRPATAPVSNKPQHTPSKRIVADIDPERPASTVRPGQRRVLVEVTHDGVVKTKHLKPGQRVRPFVRGEARGSERIVAKVTRIDDGAMVEVEWASAHVTSQHKAAYRWYDADLDGTTTQHTEYVAGFVAVHEAREEATA